MRSRPLLVVVIAFAVVFAGCSGAPTMNSGGDTLTTTTTTADAPSTTTTGTTTVDTPNGTLSVHVINVGQSASILVVGPDGETMLIDTGHYYDDGEYVLSYLQERGITRLDHLVTTHNDADHIGGNAAVIEYFETEGDGVGAVYDPGIAASTQTYQAYLDAVEQYDVTLYEVRAGDTLPFEGANVSVLGPPEPYIDGEARNENSVILKLAFGESSFLLTGDAEETQEEWLVEEYGEQLNVTVLKAGHHGSSSSTSPALLDVATAKVVPISSAYDSQYGHPHEEVLQCLAERDIPAYWTATHGDLVFTTNGSAVTVATQQSAPTAPLSLRDGTSIEPSASGGVERRAIFSATGGGTAPIDSSPPETTTTVADGGTDPSALIAAQIHADAEGDESSNLNDEYVVFENTGETALDMGGWTVQDESGKTYTVPDEFVLDAGAQVTLHTGSGSDTDRDLYWGYGSAVWNNGGDTVIVTTDTGEVVIEETY
ncbi:lamin tail domain-containing protein [Halarchaeum sp. CBA1220]|uniref:lamin tail domain-containing protein n=1 Tax=Halarchaeum sp. CBA1220 TaxID=1853682 RepID=UPI0021037131|nr:lamin tail domain-containing protein [Halarchaeum sp. CBA1220]